MAKIQIIIADDHSIFRKGLRQILEEEQDIEIIGEAADGQQALVLVDELKPDLLILDISMPVLNGLETSMMIVKRKIRTRPLILSMHNNENYIKKSIESGAYGYLLKDASKEEILMAIRKVATGLWYYGSSVSDIIIRQYIDNTRGKFTDKSTNADKKSAHLSKKEKQILSLIIDGLNSRQIAEKMGLSIRTVDNHRANMMKKNHVKNTAELVRMSLENQWIE